MHLQSLARHRVSLAGREFEFTEGETILTEISCKYSIVEFQELAREAGFEPIRYWTDAGNLFSVHYLTVR